MRDWCNGSTRVFQTFSEGSIPLSRSNFRAYSLMVKQTTHNRWSLGSIPSGPTKYGVSLMDKTGDFYSLDMGSIPVRRAKSH